MSEIFENKEEDAQKANNLAVNIKDRMNTNNELRESNLKERE